MRLGVAAAVVGGSWCPGDVSIVDGRVEDVGLSPAVGDRVAVPGLVDVLCHGHGGIDLAGATVAEAVAVRRAVAAGGVTAFCPGLITGSPDAVVAALGVLDAARGEKGGARLLGAHLEGPFLAATRLGTHPPEHRRDPDPALLARLLDAGRVDVMTLAPEPSGALALVAELGRRGTVALAGHSDADAVASHAGFDAGVAGVTHLFNAMSGLDHRAPGLAAVALTRTDVVVTVIADGHHVAPEMLRLVAATAPGRWAMITDATAAAGMPEGAYRLADVPLTLQDGVVRNAAGALAGSAATLAGGIRVAAAAGVGLVDAATAATTTPARLLGRTDLGRLVPGAVADVTVLDDRLEVVDTLIAGAAPG
jgi:N-acetylglucosamine-6-phosphate deacetylase